MIYSELKLKFYGPASLNFEDRKWETDRSVCKKWERLIIIPVPCPELWDLELFEKENIKKFTGLIIRYPNTDNWTENLFMQSVYNLILFSMKVLNQKKLWKTFNNELWKQKISYSQETHLMQDLQNFSSIQIPEYEVVSIYS